MENLTKPAQEIDGARLRPGIAWGNVVHDTLSIPNPAALALRLREELELGDGRTDYGRVLHALDRSAHNFDDAGRLARAAKVEEERFGLLVAERLEVMKSDAMSELMAEYHRKERRSPTNDDVECRILAKWPDEYRSLKERQAELHGAVRSLEVLQSAWASRCADLRVMADRVRS